MRRLLYYIGLIDLVWIQYFEGDIHLRVVWNGTNGKRYVFGICGPPMFWNVKQNTRELLPGGTLGKENGNSYMSKWFPYGINVTKKKRTYICPFKGLLK